MQLEKAKILRRGRIRRAAEKGCERPDVPDIVVGRQQWLDADNVQHTRENRSSRAHGVVDLSALVPHSGNLFVHPAGEMRSR